MRQHGDIVEDFFTVYARGNQRIVTSRRNGFKKFIRLLLAGRKEKR